MKNAFLLSARNTEENRLKQDQEKHAQLGNLKLTTNTISHWLDTLRVGLILITAEIRKVTILLDALPKMDMNTVIP